MRCTMKCIIYMSGAIILAFVMISCADSVVSPVDQPGPGNQALQSVVMNPVQADAASSGNRNFRAHMNGSEEVPPAETRGQGQAIFRLDQDGTGLSYKLIVANTENVLQVHIHCGAAGVNGPVVAFLYPAAPPAELIPGRFNGVLAEGFITNANVISRPDSDACPGGLANFDELMAKIRSGDAYVNVHTLQYPAGEIRGQIN